MYLTDEADVRAFAERAAASSVLAVDTEFLREKTYYPRLCLLQLATAEESAIVDPILVKDLSCIADLFRDTRITKVFHACGQDLEVIYAAMGCVPDPIFDTQVAAAFLGHRQQIGYGPLVEAYCGVHLAKAESLTDWSKRPLDAAQLRYAEEDVSYLPGIYERMLSELVEKGRLGWVLPEFQSMLDPSKIVTKPEEAYLHLKRSTSLTKSQLAIAREICAWREREAARLDVPKRWVLSDEIVVECCRRQPTVPARLLRIRGTEQLTQASIAAVCNAVKRGLSADISDIKVAHRHARPSAETESVVDLMYALLRIKADRYGIASQVIATRDDLLEFLRHPEASPLSTSWKKEVIGDDLTRLLQGEIGLTVKDGGIELL